MKSRKVNVTTEMIEVLRHIPWVAGRPDGYYFIADPLVINAAPAAVWQHVKTVTDYERFSAGSFSASLPQGDLMVDNNIHVVLYANECIGKFLPASDERISMLDDEHHMLAWERKIPGGTTECYRVLEPLEGGTKTKSYIALKMPGCLGFFTHALLKNKIEQAFDQLNHGIKVASEQPQYKPTI